MATTNDGGTVLEQGHLDGDVGAGLHVLENLLPVLGGFAAHLPEGAGE
jgi:hypothetical protein